VTKSPPTITDVAKAAGVSHATAARALGGYGSVSVVARTRVESAAARLGYLRNTLASSMVTGRTQIIGFVGADMGNPFFARALRGASDVARTAGFEIIIANTDEDPRLERAALRVLAERRIDGAIVAPAELEHPDSLREFAATVPVVCLDRAAREVATDAVLIDNVGAARTGVARLIALGHERIGLITSQLGDDPLATLASVALDPLHAIPGAARAAGYVAALRSNGVDVDADLIRTTNLVREEAAAATRALLRLPAPPTAIFAVDNVRTLGAFDSILDSGLDFPGEVSLLGFDDLEWATIVRPALTVVAQPDYELGAIAAQRLIARLKGDDSAPQVVLLEAALVERDSVASRCY
jgi:LacI family transcriptional regulator